jgi:hypothetical protein
VGDGRPDHQRGVGHPPGDDDVGPGRARPGDAEGAEVGVRAERRAEAEIAGPRGQVVAADQRDPGVQAQLADGPDQPGRVDAAGVGHDAHAAVQRQPQAVAQLGEERPGVAGGRVGRPVAPEDQHGQLGEVVAGEHVQLAALEHLPHRGEPVAVEPGAVADAQRLGIRGPAHAP